jgi:hypothetical protein
VLLAVIVFGVVAAAMAVFMNASEQPDTVAVKFLNALGTGNVDELTRLSYMDKVPPEEIRKKWDFTVHVAGPYYRFRYVITSGVMNDAETAAVRLDFYRNALSSQTYSDQYELPLVKIGNQWKVDVRGLNREMYPGLPK